MKGFKTVLLGVLLAAGSFFGSDNPDIQKFIAENMDWIGSSLGAVVIGLRALTTSAIFRKE